MLGGQRSEGRACGAWCAGQKGKDAHTPVSAACADGVCVSACANHTTAGTRPPACATMCHHRVLWWLSPCSASSRACCVLLSGCVSMTKSNSAGAAQLTWKTARLGRGWLMLGSHSLMPESSLQVQHNRHRNSGGRAEGSWCRWQAVCTPSGVRLVPTLAGWQWPLLTCGPLSSLPTRASVLSG